MNTTLFLLIDISAIFFQQNTFFRWTLAQTESSELIQEKQDKLHNTYYNNMVMYINNKTGDNESTISGIKGRRQSLAKSRESLYSTMLPVKEDREEAEECSACRQCDSCCDSCCCSFWSWILILLFLMGGFTGQLQLCLQLCLQF